MFKHFNPSEILSPEGLMEYEEGNLLLQGFAIKSLNIIRENIDEAIFINHGGLRYRGYRSPDENAIIEGSAHFSRHVQGIAFDCTIKSKRYELLALCAIMAGAKGIGYYPDKNFMHIDFRTSDSVICWHSKAGKIETFTIKTETIDSQRADIFLKVLATKFGVCH